jgi:thiosulfate/3-mercaptopyruvate sulfurtransferase
VPPRWRPGCLTLHDGPTATREYLQSRLGAADLAIWDARGPLEYSGEKVLAAKGGHIPGAVNFEWTAGMDKARNLRIRTTCRRSSKTSGSPGQRNHYPLPDPSPLWLHLSGGQVARLSAGQRLRRFLGRMGQPPDTPVEI